MAYSVDPKATMGLHDYERCTTLEFEVDFYPRIKHFQSELKCLFFRFQKLYDQLPGSMKSSVESVISIKNAALRLTNSRPMLFLFGPASFEILTGVSEGDFERELYKTETSLLEEIHHLDGNEKNYKMVLAICTLRMMDTAKGRDALQKVKRLFGEKNMMIYVDKHHERNKDMVVNTLEQLHILLKLNQDDIKVVYESGKGIFSNYINNHMEYKFVNTFKSLNTFLFEVTKKRSRTHGLTFGDKRTGGRFYKEIKTHFESDLTVIDLLMSSEGETTEQKLATVLVDFTTTLLIRDIAETYEIHELKVLDYCQQQNFREIWITTLQKHLHKVPLVKKLDQFVRTSNDESVICDAKKHYKLDDAKTLGKEVTKALMGHFLQVGLDVKKIRVHLDLLICLRKELLNLMEETIDGGQYLEPVPTLENWRKELLGIKEVEAVGLVLEKPVVLVKTSGSTERDREVCTQIKKLLKGFPSEITVEFISTTFFAGRHGNGINSKLVMGDAFISESGNRGTIGLFMHEDDTEHSDLHFVTCSHVVLGSEIVKTNEQCPVIFGRARHTLLTGDGLVDIAAIRIEKDMQSRCKIDFEENGEKCTCTILDIGAIRNLKEGKHVYKRGSTTGETKGSIISEDFLGSNLKTHNILVGLLAGSDQGVLKTGFAQEGDSGAVLYTKSPNGEVHYFAMLMGKYNLRDEEDNPSSKFNSLTSEIGPLILSTCLREGLNRIEQKFNFKLTLPT